MRSPFAPRLARALLAALVALPLLAPSTSHASFHLWEITKIMTSHDGDAAVQAVEMKALTSGENQVSTASLVVYDVSGVAGATLGTFAADLPVGGAVTGAHILFATMKFKQRFGITPDIQISAGLLPTNGQVSFEKPGSIVNVVSYGGIVTQVPGGGNVSSAPPLPSGGAPILVRFQDNAIFPSLPQSDDAANRFQLRTATSTFPVSFTNYSGVTVNVFSTVTGVEGTPGVSTAPRAFPNPFQGTVRVESPASGWVGVFDVRGSLVRVLHESPAATMSYRGDWDGRDTRGNAVPAGIYFIRFGRETGAPVTRVALLR